MRILEGLHATKIRRLWGRDLNRPEALFQYAKTKSALAWRPEIAESYEMWAAHTEVVYRQRVAEELTRERELA